MNVKIRARHGALEKLARADARVETFMNEYQDNVYARLVYGSLVEIRIRAVFPSVSAEVALAVMVYNGVRVMRIA